MRKRIGKLDCIVREGEDPKNCVVLLHGFGAEFTDLAPLADVLDPDGQWTFYFPNAPLEVPIGPGYTGRGWFPISLRDLEVGVDFTKIRPPGLDQSREMVSQLIFELNPQKLVLGGFSQGAMIATEVALTQPEDIAALILFSGTMLDEEGWTKKAKGLAGKPVLQSHGSADQVLPIVAAQKLSQVLQSAGAKIEFVGFPGGHEIPRPVVAKASSLLRGL
jgi:phospholipase/carboxylesterase